MKNEWLILEIQQGLQNFSSPRIPSSIGQDARPSHVHLGHMLCANQILFCATYYYDKLWLMQHYFHIEPLQTLLLVNSQNMLLQQLLKSEVY